MSAVGDKFKSALGAPDPATPNGLGFTGRSAVREWKSLHDEIGSGWFKNRFLYLFGEGLEQFQPCLDAWPFLVPPGHADRMIIGKNAYGALLVLEDGNTLGSDHVYVLDPFQASYWSNPNITLVSLIGRWLSGNDTLNGFLDDSAYQEWVKAHGVEPGLDDVLGIKVPKPLGGKLELDNLQLDGMTDYYQTTAPIYAKAFAGLAQK
jgi:hypothetical protein